MTVLSNLIYETDRWIAINKAPGVSLATGHSGSLEAVERLLSSLGPSDRQMLWEGPEGLHLVHRLDVGTSGVVLLARDPEAHAALVRAFSERHVHKIYVALVWGRPRPKEGTWDWPLGPDREDRRRMRMDSEGKPSTSHYRTLAESSHASLLELRPETGRTHQLRVHCAHAGHLIVGDDLYGGPRERGVRDRVLREQLSPDRPLLHAAELHLPATTAGPETRLRAPLPEDFSGVLRFLRIDLPE